MNVKVTDNAIEYLADACGLNKEEAEEHVITVISMCLLSPEAPVIQCLWTQVEDGGDWDTSCGDLFTLLEGTPKDNDMKYCAYCGGVLIEKPYEQQSFDD